MKKKLIVLSGFVLGAAPFLAFAQNPTGGLNNNCLSPQPGTIAYILCMISSLLNTVIPLLIALAVIYFIWGVISFVIAGDEEAKTKGRNKIIYGLIGLAVIVAMWGFVRILTTTLGVNTGPQNITLPTVPYNNTTPLP